MNEDPLFIAPGGTPAVPPLPDAEIGIERPASGRYTLAEGTSLRQHTARGTLITGVFNVGISALSFLKGFVLAIFLSPKDYGIWGILLISLGTLSWLKQVGIADKYVQQDEDDQVVAFQKAFTIEAIANGLLLVLLIMAVPLMAIVYGRSDLLLPGFTICLLIPAAQLQVPFWVLYRRLEFRRQRTLQVIDPAVGVLSTIALAVAGAGYWALIIGTILGSYAGAIVAVRTSAYPLRFRYDRGTLRSYAGFSAPLFLASVGGIVIAQGSIFFGNDALGIAGAGAIALGAQIGQMAQRADDVISGTLYPVIAAVRERADVMFETFEKSNRVALMWAMPFGIGLALFANDLTRWVIGERWHPAVVVLQAAGIAAAINQLGFNWTAYVRASGKTRPIAVCSIAIGASFLATVPLLYSYHLRGYALSTLIVVVVSVGVRSYYLAQMFSGFGMAAHFARALLPSMPAIVVVLAVRAVEHGAHRTLPIAVGELALYGLVTVAATWSFERVLIRESAGYLRRQRVGPAVA